MSKASSVVASVIQQSMGREFHSLRLSTENARRPHEFRRDDDQRRSVDDIHNNCDHVGGTKSSIN